MRSLSWRVDFNLSTVCGVESDADKAKRELFRQTDFRRAVTQGVDREAMAQALVRGPFVAPFAGGLHVETDFFKPESVVYYPYDVRDLEGAPEEGRARGHRRRRLSSTGAPVRSRARTWN